MASLNQVTIELKVSGERQATKALRAFADANKRVGSAVGEVGRKVSSIEGEFRRLNDLKRQGSVTTGAFNSALTSLARQLATLTGQTEAQARAELRAIETRRRQEERTRRAAQAAEELARAQRNLEGSVLRQAQAVNQAVQRLAELNRLKARGIAVAGQYEQAELEVARALARTNGYLTANGALNTQKALAEIRAAQATQQAAAADAAAAATKQRLTQSYNQLLASINPVIARQQQTRQTVQMLRAAVAAGAITTTQAAQALLQYRAALQAAGSAGLNSSGGINRFGVITQQAGYQFGDFFVQVQSGTNIMVAFGQQATQLVGTFAALATSTRMIMLFSGLGVLISIGTAIGAAMMRASGETDTLQQKLDKLEQSVDKLFRTLDRLDDAELDQTFGNMTNEIVSLTEAMVALDSAAVLNNLMSAIDRIETAASAKWWETIFPSIDTIFSLGAIRGSRREVDQRAFNRLGFSMDRDPFMDRVRDIERLASGGRTEDVVRELASLMREVSDEGAELSATGISLMQSLESAAVSTAEMAARMNGSAEAAQLAAEAAEEEAQSRAEQIELSAQLTEQQNRRNQALVDRIRGTENEIRVMQLTLQYGEDSVEVQRELNRQARARVVTEMMAAGHSAESIAAYIALVRQAQELEGALRDAANSAGDTADAASRIGPALSSAIAQANAFADAMARARSESAGIGISTAGIQAEIAALQGGASQAEARAQAAAVTLREQLFAQFPTQGIGPSGATAAVQDIEQQVEARRQLVLERERAQAELSRLRSSSTGDGDGGGAAEDIFTSRIAGIQELYEAVRVAREETRMFEEQVSVLDDALDNGLITQQRYNELLREAQDAYGQAATGAYDYQSALEQVSNRAQSAMEDAFMSIIDGSASASDAFRDMARQILAEAVRLLVVRPMINNLFGALGGGGGFLGGLFGGGKFANGAAFLNGNVVPFANGDVVSSPTMFPMAGGRTGLMGEAGPEAIMPLKRTRGGNLGVAVEGGGSVVINQTFQFSANGDESVKRIIAEEAPRIANLTQRQILDQRRRGGVMKATF